MCRQLTTGIGLLEAVVSQCLELYNGHLGGVIEDDIPKNTVEIWAGSLNPLYVILSNPAQMSSIFKIHWDQGTVKIRKIDLCHIFDVICVN